MKHLYFILPIGILTNCIAFDQATKQLAKVLLPSLSALKISSTLDFRWIENRKAFMDFTTYLPDDLKIVFFSVVAFVLLLAFVEVMLIASKLHPLVIGGLSLAAGGGLSNLIDKLTNGGKVVDFIAWKPSFGHFFIFNYADVVIFIGAFLLVLWTLGYFLSSMLWSASHRLQMRASRAR